MKKRRLYIIFVVLLILVACDLSDTEKTISQVKLMIDVANIDDIAYEIFVNSAKQCSISADSFGYFMMYVYLHDTYQLEIKNAGYLYDTISFTPAEDAEQMQPDWSHYGEADYWLGILIREGKLSFKD
ncbi:MAG: hypothetical protein ACETWM_17415 [Candidatus Lokiarchaeia archaeon]